MEPEDYSAHHHQDPDDQGQEPDRISERSRRKGIKRREAEAMRLLARRLFELSSDKVADLPLSVDASEALELARRLTSHEARRRQLQRVAKLLRESDTEAVQEAIERMDQSSSAAIAEHHRIERWRARLIDEGDAAIAEYLSENPDIDRQRLRQLVRAARNEQAAEKAPKSSRELFRLLRDAKPGY